MVTGGNTLKLVPDPIRVPVQLPSYHLQMLLVPSDPPARLMFTGRPAQILSLFLLVDAAATEGILPVNKNPGELNLQLALAILPDAATNNR